MKRTLIRLIIATTTFLCVAAVAGAKNRYQHHGTAMVPGIVVARVKPGITIQSIANSIAAPSIVNISRTFPSHASSTLLSRIYTIHINPELNPAEFAAKLSKHEIFEYVEPRYLATITETIPNDTLLGQQFYLEQIGMFQAWDLQRGSDQVVIAIVDNGTDYRHPDLRENIWANQAEAAGKPGFDDDGNGYIDDIHGWDFGENDNDPSYGTDESRLTIHGTHTAGLASAVTNNITGIAGVGWNCKIMPIKVSEDENTRFTPFGYEGVVYAADNGADVINNSWGREGAYSQFEQDVIDYAVSRGSIVIGAAGNSDKNGIFFPAGYIHVIAVAAVNEVDQKASYSNFGKFVDLVAPGGDASRRMLSTIPVELGSYGVSIGTSMASPVVAGAMGLLRSQFPFASRYQLTRRLVLSCDNIDELNRQYVGLLGYGRLNVFGALTEDIQEEEPARIEFWKAATNDSLWGNGNYLYERGETIGIDVWYRNFAISPARNLVVTLSSDDSDLIVSKGRVVLKSVPPDTIVALSNQLGFFITPDAMPHTVRLILSYSLDNGNGGVDTLYSIIGKSSVLLVDDDDGRRNMEQFYKTALDQYQVSCLHWDHARMGTPPAGLLAHFPLVIWFCEWAFPSLDSEDRMAIASYLNRGGRLFISGQDIGWDLADPSSDSYSENSVQFFRRYLHAEYLADHSGSSEVIGIPGTLCQGMRFHIYQPRISAHLQFPEWIEPTEDAQSCFRYDNDRGAGISYANDNKVFYMGFGFEAMDSSPSEDPFRISRIRSEFMAKILDNYGLLTHIPIRDMEESNYPTLFRVTVSPLVDDVEKVSLFWNTPGMLEFSAATMDSAGDRSYQALVDLTSVSGTVSYYFQLTTPYYQFQLPAKGRTKPFSFSIGPDHTPPKFYHLALNDVFLQPAGREVEVVVQDNLGVDSNSVWLHYQAAGEDSVPMTYRGNQRYQAFIPPVPVIGDSLCYYFSARDIASVPNRSRSIDFCYRIGVEGFERGLDFWVTDPGTWGLDDRQSHSGTFCVSTFPGKPYPDGINATLRSKFGISRRQLQDRALTFWTKFELQKNKDFGYVEISPDNGKHWVALDDGVTGRSNNWLRKQYDLSAFYTDTDDTLLLRFRMQTDSTQTQPMPGWFIDDIAFERGTAVRIGEAAEIATADRRGVQLFFNSPNPFNAATKVGYRITVPGRVTFMVYNLLGQMVAKQSVGFQQPGSYQLQWDGTDSQGNPCDSGIYFGRLMLRESGTQLSRRHISTIKMILVK